MVKVKVTFHRRRITSAWKLNSLLFSRAMSRYRFVFTCSFLLSHQLHVHLQLNLSHSFSPSRAFLELRFALNISSHSPLLFCLSPLFHFFLCLLYFLFCLCETRALDSTVCTVQLVSHSLAFLFWFSPPDNSCTSSSPSSPCIFARVKKRNVSARDGCPPPL